MKPLFYAVHDGRIVLASEVKALWAAGVPAAWNDENLYRYLTRQPIRTGDSIFRGVRQVPPGHLVRFSGDRASDVAYWDFDYPRAADIDNGAPIDVHVARLRETYLSGGLDSSVVTGMAASLIGSGLRAFTVSFPREQFDDHDQYDELETALDTARHLGIELTKVAVSQADLADHFAEALEYSELPAMSPHGVGKFLLSRAAHRAGYKCVLTGEGADELFGGYSIFFETMLLHNTEGQDPATVASLRAALARNHDVFAPHGAADPFVDAASDARAASRSDSWCAPGLATGLDDVERILGFVPRHWSQCREMAMTQLFSEGFLRQHGDGRAFGEFLSDLDLDGQLRGRDPLNQELYLYAKTTLAGWILNILSDRMEMAHAIEGRLPFLDHHVIECATHIPVAMKIRGRTEKFVLREAARPYVTEAVLARRKHGFFTPRSFRPGPLEHLRQDVLRSHDLPACFDRARIVETLDRQPDLDPRSAQQVQNASIYALSVTLLSERFGL